MSSTRPEIGPGLAAGDVVGGRFRLQGRIGEGGMGIVWRATHVVTRKPVALKFLRRDSDARAVQRFLREARAACSVQHPNVVEVHDVLQLDDGSPFMVMDLLMGETLATKLERTRVLPLADLAGIMVHVCSAVGAAHALGIVHRDLKPENIFLATNTGVVEVKVLDFGIAKLTASEGDAASSGAATATGAILGTPYYMAPEQLFAEKDIDLRADVWAIGVILYEALAGERPTAAANVGQIYKRIMSDGIVPLRERAPSLPRSMLNLVDQCLSRSREKRPADLRQVLEVLRQHTSEASLPVPAPGDTKVASSAPEFERKVDSDTARASTISASRAAGSSPRGPGRRLVPWLGAVLILGAGFAAWRYAQAPALAVSAASPGAVTGSSVLPSVDESVVPPTTGIPAAESSSQPSASASTVLLRSGLIPVPALRRLVVAPTKADASGPVPGSTVDPGSYP